ncbi:MAG: putative toxin-antitoxin system toxin component, PIN family [Spirochaetaceae bacterium]|jgi:putative PIN family toxin of toxin-antitoxin system|nr:putative toxin-antitoxin system toxin component, PIN family [Spirochaetaceae bacterium]
MKVVIDTNVLVSAMLNPRGVPAEIMSLVLSGSIKLLYDNRILQEYVAVLNREEFGFEKGTVQNFIDFVKNESEFVVSGRSNTKFTDEDDRKFYEVYTSGNAKYLVTGNMRHYPAEKTIVSPKKFLESTLGGH